MKLIDEEEIELQKKQTNKLKKIIIILIIFLLLLCAGIVALIIYRTYNPDKITTYINGIEVQDFDQILDLQIDENGKTQIYVPIREFATYLNLVDSTLGYQTFKGDYEPKTEESDKCYTIRSGYEVAIYTNKSRVIYKVNLQSNNTDYDEYYIDTDIFENNGVLYASKDGIEAGYNVSFSYDESKKTITIYTLEYLINAYQTSLASQAVGNYGKLTIVQNYTNWKSVFDGLLIVQSSNGKYGIIETSNYNSFILEPQYDSISFMDESATFLVKSNDKVGLFSEEGKRKINLIYDEITSMGQDSNLYVVKTNNMYGVVDEDGNIIIYPEYESIGIDVSKYVYNGIKNGYILLNKLIPVKQGNMWGFFDKQGNTITDGFIYKDIGCTKVKNGNNIYPLLEIQDYNIIVVQDELGMYSFMDIDGNDTMLPFVFEEVYIKITTGEENYCMTYREQEYNILQYINRE